MRPFHLLALLLSLLLVPGLARGQAPASPPVESPEPPPDTVSPPPLTPVEEAPPEDAEPAPGVPRGDPAGGPSLGRGFLELVGGGTLAVLAGYATLSLGAEQCDGDSDACVISVFLLTASSTLLAAPLGVYATGSLLDGQGSLGATFLGSLIGAGVGFGSGLLLAATGGGVTLLLLGIPLGALIGSVVGYEVVSSNGGSVAARRGAPASGPRMMPTVGVTPRGGLVGGLVGRF